MRAVARRPSSGNRHGARRGAATPGHPVVYGEWLRADGRPTVARLRPLRRPARGSACPPGNAAVRAHDRGEDLSARGASDDKGQIYCHLKATRGVPADAGRAARQRQVPHRRRGGDRQPESCRLPGGQRRLVAADVPLVSDTRFVAKGRPAITYALRGRLTSSSRSAGPGRDLHSGGLRRRLSAIRLEALCEIAAGSHDAAAADRGSGVLRRRAAGGAERAVPHGSAVGPSDAQMARDAMAQRGWGEPGYSLYERTTIRPP